MARVATRVEGFGLWGVKRSVACLYELSEMEHNLRILHYMNVSRYVLQGTNPSTRWGRHQVALRAYLIQQMGDRQIGARLIGG